MTQQQYELLRIASSLTTMEVSAQCIQMKAQQVGSQRLDEMMTGLLLCIQTVRQEAEALQAEPEAKAG